MSKTEAVLACLTKPLLDKSVVLIYPKCRSLAGSLSPSAWSRSSKFTLKMKVLILVLLELSSTKPGSRDDPSI